MLKGFLLIVMVVILTGCAMGLRPAPADLALLPTEPTIWKLVLRRGGEPLYTGLLLLSREEKGTDMILLDATGIKLLEGRLSESGELSGRFILIPLSRTIIVN